MKKKLLVLLLVLFAFPVFAADNPRIAVVPFNAIGVSEKDAQVLTGLFETALVKTDSFSVIEQNQVKEIVEAQAYSMSGCTDEACAIEFGELLAAEQIILGELSVIGGKYILNAKIIDVAQGSNIKADNVEADSMADMTQATELLAFKLAGLTFSSGSSVRIAEDFGEVLIETQPSGADIFVNGVKKGVSPDLIGRIPIGMIRIEAKKGNLYGVKDVSVSSETGRISLFLEEMFGNIFIKSSERDVDVFIDGRGLGPLGTGFFERISIGGHSLELKGPNSRWEGEIIIENGKSTKVEAFPRPYGTVRYGFPEDVSAEFLSRDERHTVRNSGELELWTGKITVTASGGRYENLTEEIEISKGKTVYYNPEMKTVKMLEQQYFQSLYDDAENRLQEASNSAAMSERMVHEIQETKKELADSQHNFPALSRSFEELYDKAVGQHRLRVDLDKLAQLEAERAIVQTAYDLVSGPRFSSDAMGWLCLAAGLGGLTASGISYFKGEEAFDEYTSTTSASIALTKRSEVQTFDVVLIAAGGAGLALTLLSPIFFSSGPDVKPYLDSMKELDFKIAELKARTAK